MMSYFAGTASDGFNLPAHQPSNRTKDRNLTIYLLLSFPWPGRLLHAESSRPIANESSPAEEAVMLCSKLKASSLRLDETRKLDFMWSKSWHVAEIPTGVVGIGERLACS